MFANLNPFMVTIKVKAPELIQYEELKGFSPKIKEAYTSSKIKDFLQLNKETGISIKAICKNSYFDRHTVSRILKILVAKGEIYPHQIDSKTTIFFPNGNVVDSIGEVNVNIGGKFYSVYKLKSQFGQSIYIQEKRKTPLEALEVSGGIIVPLESHKAFLSFLQDAFGQVGKYNDK